MFQLPVDLFCSNFLPKPFSENEIIPNCSSGQTHMYFSVTVNQQQQKRDTSTFHPMIHPVMAVLARLRSAYILWYQAPVKYTKSECLHSCSPSTAQAPKQRREGGGGGRPLTDKTKMQIQTEMIGNFLFASGSCIEDCCAEGGEFQPSYFNDDSRQKCFLHSASHAL